MVATRNKKKNSDDTAKSWGEGGLLGGEIGRVMGSLFLLTMCPFFALTAYYICYNLDGDLVRFISVVQGYGIKNIGSFLYDTWPEAFDSFAMKQIGGYMILQLLLMRFVPGKEFKATPTPSGHIPIYTANGVQCYLLTIVIVMILWYYRNDTGYNPASVYEYMPRMLSSMNVFALGFCTMLMFKGLYYPSTQDSGSNGNIIVDYFWGTELYPRILGWDVKQFTNCRFGMMFWQVGIICYAMKQYDMYGYISSSMLTSVLIQTVYIAKFFWWETGYFCSMDIQHDRAGYYICWGCLVWVPSMYTIHTYFMTTHPTLLSLPFTLFLNIVGIWCIWCNFDCDKQRQEFRRTNGRLKIWGEDPEYIEAKYKTADGEIRTSLLLLSGWWGLSRHFHYIPEIGAAFFWCVPVMFSHIIPFFYPVYLTILLFDRAWRDDARCGAKYGIYWEQYCERVPCKVIPGVI